MNKGTCAIAGAKMSKRSPVPRLFAALVLAGVLVRPGAALAQPEKAFDISVAQMPLADALKAVAQQTGENILFTSDTVSNLSVTPLKGHMSARQAVDQLLQGLHLQAVSDGNGGLIVEHVLAQAPPPVPEAPALPVEEVVVTGTSIRGVAPPGTNLISMSKEEMQSSGATTVQSFLADSTMISGFGNAGEGSRIHNNYYQPSIHNLGASGSNATLVLLDGHQFPTGGTNHTTADPNVIPFNMLQSVEVIANGDSSIYGSNAVAGVINFITRSRFDGVELNAQSDIMDGVSNFTGGILSGASWNRGNVVFAYQYVNEGMLTANQRIFLKQYQPDRGRHVSGASCGPGRRVFSQLQQFYRAPARAAPMPSCAPTAPATIMMW